MKQSPLSPHIKEKRLHLVETINKEKKRKVTEENEKIEKNELNQLQKIKTTYKTSKWYRTRKTIYSLIKKKKEISKKRENMGEFWYSNK